MGEAQSAQIIPIIVHAGPGRGCPAGRIARLVAGSPGAVKADRGGADAGGDLLRPSFEAALGEGPRLWLRRLLWRRRLRAAFGHETEAVLGDFGLTKESLERYLARPFWRA